MTKKSLAALMLAGAMMTVGSGAMAADPSLPIVDTTTGKATVETTYTTAEKIDITVSWTTPDAFAFTWADGAWTYAGTAKSLAFSATNVGSKDKTVSLAVDANSSPEWIKADAKAGSTAVNKVTAGTSSAQTVAEFDLSVDNTKLTGITANSSTAVDAPITFNVTISD